MSADTAVIAIRSDEILAPQAENALNAILRCHKEAGSLIVEGFISPVARKPPNEGAFRLRGYRTNPFFRSPLRKLLAAHGVQRIEVVGSRLAVLAAAVRGAESAGYEVSAIPLTPEDATGIACKLPTRKVFDSLRPLEV